MNTHIVPMRGLIP